MRKVWTGGALVKTCPRGAPSTETRKPRGIGCRLRLRTPTRGAVLRVLARLVVENLKDSRRVWILDREWAGTRGRSFRAPAGTKGGGQDRGRRSLTLPSFVPLDLPSLRPKPELFRACGVKGGPFRPSRTHAVPGYLGPITRNSEDERREPSRAETRRKEADRPRTENRSKSDETGRRRRPAQQRRDSLRD